MGWTPTTEANIGWGPVPEAAQGGGVPTPTVLNIVPASDVTYTVGATLDGAGGVLHGWGIQGDGFITRVQEYAAGRIEIDYDFTGTLTNYRWSTVAACMQDAPVFLHPDQLVGDFDLAVEFKALTTPPDNFTMVGPVVDIPATTLVDATCLAAMFGNVNTTNARAQLVRGVKSAMQFDNALDDTLYAWTLQQFVQLVRDGGNIKANRKTLVGDSWVTCANKEWNTVGDPAPFGFGLGTDYGVGKTGTVAIYGITGNYLPSTVLP